MAWFEGKQVTGVWWNGGEGRSGCGRWVVILVRFLRLARNEAELVRTPWCFGEGRRVGWVLRATTDR
jgi:hypothetical protein